MWIVAFSELLILLHCISIELGIVVLAFVDGLLILALAELVVVNDLHVCWLFLALPFLAHYIFSGIPLRFFALSFLYKFDVHNLNP